MLLLALSVALPLVAGAEPAEADAVPRVEAQPPAVPARDFPDVVQPLPGGTMDWTNLRLRVESRSDHQVGAWKDRRIQEQDALDSIAPTLDGLVRRLLVTAEKSAGDLMSAEGSLAAGLRQRADDWQVVESRYHSDGGVEMSAELDVRLWLQPALAELTAGPLPEIDPDGATGILIDARGQPFVPGLLPTVRTSSGRSLVQAAAFARVLGDRKPPVVYVTDPADPRAARRIGERPILAVATGAGGALLTVEEGVPIASSPEVPVLVATRRVVIVVDPPE